MAATAETLRFVTQRDLDTMPELHRLPPWRRHAMRVVSHVLPFRTNRYVVEELIDWDRVPDDPIFQLTFPQPTMLSPHAFRAVERAMGTA